MLLLLALSASASDVVFVGGTVHIGTGDVLESASVHVREGKIEAVGTDVAVPDGAEVIDVAGKVLIPGLVDTHSHIGSTGDLHEGGMTPGVSAIDAIDATHDSIQRAQAGGITVANVMPGSGTLIGGQTAYLKLRDVATVDEMLMCDDRRDGICGGMKMANGTNPQGGSGPDSRMGAAKQQREKLMAAKKRKEEVDKAKKPPEAAKKSGLFKKKETPKPPKAPEPDLGLDPMVELLSGQRTVHFHTHRADDIVTILKLREEFGLDVVLHHVSEAWKVVDAIAEAGAPCSLIVIDSPGGKEEAVEIKLENAALLHERGVLVSLHTDDPITDSRLFLRSAALAVRAGLPEEAALATLTANPAKQLHLDARIGTLEKGKDADLVVLSGPPLSVWTQVEQTWVDGQKVFDRSDPDDRRWATGGDRVPGRYPEGVTP